jgi:drug/metabolite transporter (DMT)-like permease
MTCTVIANLSLKIGAQRRDDVAGWPAAMINTHVLIGAASFALAFLFYALVLRRLPLTLAQAIFSVQFVLVILAANWLLHESVGGMRWLGITVMAVGLLVVSLSPNAEPVAAPAERVTD